MAKPNGRRMEVVSEVSVQEPVQAPVSVQEAPRNGFDLRRYVVNLRGAAYLPSAARVYAFCELFPGWRLVTEPVHLDWEQRVFAFCARVYDPDGNLVRTGYAMASLKDSTDPLEKAETAAIARALGHLGISSLAAQQESSSGSSVESSVSSNGITPRLRRIAQEFGVDVRDDDTTQVLLRRLYDRVVDKSDPWPYGWVALWVRNDEVLRLSAAHYREHGSLSKSAMASWLNVSQEAS